MARSLPSLYKATGCREGYISKCVSMAKPLSIPGLQCLLMDGWRSFECMPAAGDSAGTLHVLDLPRSLRRHSQNEAQNFDSLLKREMARLNAAPALVLSASNLHYGAGCLSIACSLGKCSRAGAGGLPVAHMPNSCTRCQGAVGTMSVVAVNAVPGLVSDASCSWSAGQLSSGVNSVA